MHLCQPFEHLPAPATGSIIEKTLKRLEQQQLCNKHFYCFLILFTLLL